MAQLALGLAGAALGSFVGAPQLGFIAGSLLGSVLFPTDPGTVKTEGPRLGDSSVSASTYGSAIPLGYGTMRIAGNMIWSSGIIERSETQTSGGGKGSLGGGGPKQEQTTYTYFASFAHAFAQREAQQVTRIWADSKLIYDRTGSRTVRQEGLSFRFYKGTETQLPDPTIEADVGSGNAPGHRGLVYIVFDELPLAEFGNRIPNITAEIAFVAESANSILFSTDINTLTSTINTTIMAVDRQRRRIYLLGGSNVIRKYNYDTLSEVQEVAFPLVGGEAISSGLYAGKQTGRLYTRVGGGNDEAMIQINQDTFELEGVAGSVRIVYGSAEGLSYSAGLSGQITPKPLLLVLHGAPDRNRLALFSTGGEFVQLYSNFNSDDMIPNPILGIIAAPPEVADAVFYVAQKATGNNPLSLWKITSNAAGTSITRTLLVTFPTTTWNNAADGTTEGIGPILDEEDGGLIFAVAGHVFKWREDVGILWTSVVGVNEPINRSTFINTSQISDHLIGWADSSGEACLVDTRDGEVIVFSFDGTTLDADWDSAGQGVFDGPTQSLIWVKGIGTAEKGFLQQLFLNREVGLGESVAGIIQDISERIGLQASDLNTTDLSSTVSGFVIARQSSARRAIEPLANAFLFDGVESDDKVKFVTRGKDPVATFTEDDLASSGEFNEVLPEQRLQEVELPERVNVLFIDKDTDYQQGSQSAKRIRQPVSSMNSRSEVTLSLPLALTNSQAKQIAEKHLFTVWNERTSYKWNAAWSWLRLDPADVVTINLSSGVSLQTRIARLAVGADLTLEFEGVREDKTTFVSTSDAQGALGFPQKPPPGPEFTNLFLLNIPLLRDVDDTNGNASRVYYGMGGYLEGWRGGNLYLSADNGASFNSIDRRQVGMQYGTAVNALPDPGVNVFQVDTTSTLEIAMQVGDLTSVTDAQFLNDENVLIVGSPTLQNWEIIAFKDAVEQPNGNFVISTFIRGKRGTEFNAGSHGAGETVIVARRDLLGAYLTTLSQINTSLLYKPVGFGSVLENVSPTPFTGEGSDLKPYAAAQPASSVDGSGNITLTWVRRTRIGGELKDGTGTVPLSEETQAYEVDIKDAVGGSVVRTLAGLTTPTAVYTAGQRANDFGVLPTLLAPGNADKNDISPNKAVSTLGAAAAINTGTTKFGVASFEFTPVGSVDPSTAFVSFPDISAYTIGTQPFTIEGWVRFKSLASTTQHIASHYNSSGNQRGWHLSRVGNALRFFASDDGTTGTNYDGAFTWSINTWYHVAVARDASDNLRIFVNGALLSTTTSTLDIFNSTEPLYLGKFRDPGADDQPLNGFVEDFRMTVGYGLYNSSFTPPAQSFLVQDPNLLRSVGFNFDGIDGATTAPDIGPLNLTPTFSGSAQIDTAQSKFGGASLLIGGDSSLGWVDVPDNAGFTFGAGVAFTIQSWIRINLLADANNHVIVSHGHPTPGTESFFLRVLTSGIVNFDWTLNGTTRFNISSGAGAITQGVWHHVAVTRTTGGVIRLFIDGTQVASTTDAGAFFDPSTALRIGGQAITDNQVVNGWLDDFEIVKGLARWTSNFTPPTVPLSPAGASPAIIGAEIFQLSAAVGRGFGREFSVPTS